MSDQKRTKSSGSNSDSNSWVTALLHLAGVMLLLPGLCSVVFSIILIRGAPALRAGYYDFAGLLMQLTGLAMGVAGMGIIVFAIYRARGEP
jgi:UPF0716 family protein affecting phage T7 exclusion